ncbi:MAG: hypothetical protein ABIH26_12250 [Candidatus Eisenbacteria bacterium]
MIRRMSALFLVVLLAAPQGALASGAAPPAERPSWMGGSVFWGALAILNTAILTSSIGDLRFYESQADEVSAGGGDAGAYWDAASREKVMIGVSAVSLLFSLAGLKGSFARPKPIQRIAEPVSRPDPLPSPPGPVQVLALENRIRYDTLFVEQASPGEEAGKERFRVTGAEAGPADPAMPGRGAGAPPPPETSPVPPDPAREEPLAGDRLDEILLALENEAAVPDPADSRASIASPGAKAAPSSGAADAESGGEEEGEPTFTLLPYGVHVSSFRTQRLAEVDETEWVRRGERVTIEEDEVPGRGTWFRLLLGSFKTTAEAKAYAADVKARYGVSYAQAQRRAGF